MLSKNIYSTYLLYSVSGYMSITMFSGHKAFLVPDHLLQVLNLSLLEFKHTPEVFIGTLN